MNLYERSLKVLAPVAKRATTLGVTSGQGSYLIDESGRKVLDFASGVALIIDNVMTSMDQFFCLCLNRLNNFRMIVSDITDRYATSKI